MTAVAEAGWFPDPADRHEFRYWDGGRWAAEVSDGGIQSVDDAVVSEWSPPGMAQKLANRSLLVVVVGVPLATVLMVVWSLSVVGTSSFGEGPEYGWSAFAKNLPVVVLMFALPILGLVWGVRASRQGARSNGKVAIWVASGGLFWALFVTDFGGLVPALGDTPGWTGFPLLLLKLLIAGGVLAGALAAAKKGSIVRASED